MYTGTIEQVIQYLFKQDKTKLFEVKEHRNKRSLDANSYCWVICEKIAQELSKDGTLITKEEVYKDAVKSVGVFIPFIVEEVAFDKFKYVWEHQGLGYQVQETAKKNKCVRVNCYYGSSSYDSKEMSRLIDALVQLAQSLNIETMPQQELNSLLESWDKNETINNAR